MDGFNYSMKAIPTKFAGVRMRSRLEARWAAFFTNCGWKWTYEPFDTDGWAPDFTLHMPAGDIYVEVKPVLTPHVRSVFIDVAGPLVSSVGARALLVGSSLDFMNTTCDAAFIGIGIDKPTYSDGVMDGLSIDSIGIGCCGGKVANDEICSCKMVAMSPQYHSYTCWVCGEYDGNPANNSIEAGVDALWADACNETQWRGR